MTNNSKKTVIIMLIICIITITICITNTRLEKERVEHIDIIKVGTSVPYKITSDIIIHNMECTGEVILVEWFYYYNLCVGDCDHKYLHSDNKEYCKLTYSSIDYVLKWF